MSIPKPSKRLVTLADARRWSPAECLIQVKADGEFQTRELAGGNIVAGEWVTGGSGAMLTPRHRQWLRESPGGIFIAFDLLQWRGEPCVSWLTSRRWASLQGVEMDGYFTPDMRLVECYSGNHFMEGMIANGGEGCVAKAWSDPYGPMLAVKASKPYDCIVTQIGGSQSVGIAQRMGDALVDRGRVTLAGGKCDKVRVGSTIQVMAMDVHESGKLRQPTVRGKCWLLNY
jgi:hypothetical protein